MPPFVMALLLRRTAAFTIEPHLPQPLLFSCTNDSESKCDFRLTLPRHGQLYTGSVTTVLYSA